MRQIFLAVTLLVLACTPHPQPYRVISAEPCALPGLPLSITVDYALFELEPEVAQAAEQWSAALDRELFKFVDAESSDAAQVYITSGPLPPVGKPDWVASTQRSCRDGKLSWVVTFHKPEFGRSFQCYTTHELGHVLGIDNPVGGQDRHTRRQASIMRARPCPDLLAEDTDTSSPFEDMPRITPEDAATVKWVWRDR